MRGGGGFEKVQTLAPLCWRRSVLIAAPWTASSSCGSELLLHSEAVFQVFMI